MERYSITAAQLKVNRDTSKDGAFLRKLNAMLEYFDGFFSPNRDAPRAPVVLYGKAKKERKRLLMLEKSKATTAKSKDSDAEDKDDGNGDDVSETESEDRTDDDDDYGAAEADAAAAALAAGLPAPRHRRPRAPLKAPMTSPVIKRESGYVRLPALFSYRDFTFALLCLAAVTAALIRTPGTASRVGYHFQMSTGGNIAQRIALLQTSSVATGINNTNGIAAAATAAAGGHRRAYTLPRVVSGDLLLMLLGPLAATMVAMALQRAVVLERKGELESTEMDGLVAAGDVDPARAAAYEAEKAERDADRKERRAALLERNAERKKLGRKPRRDQVNLTCVDEVASYTDLMLPLAMVWSVATWTVAVLFDITNSVRGLGVTALCLQLFLCAMAAKATGNITSCGTVLSMTQNVLQMMILGLVLIQWKYE